MSILFVILCILTMLSISCWKEVACFCELESSCMSSLRLWSDVCGVDGVMHEFYEGLGVRGRIT